jgi:CDP-6-deoxy-D-xylo-4-hexulose-3-dehydrase
MRALDSGWLSNGMETLNFEGELAQWFGVRHVLTVNSGSSANFVALQSLKLPRESEVITPAGGAFPTTIAPMVYLGLKPVFVDVKDMVIDPLEVEKAIGPDTKAIMFAHTLGKVADMDAIMDIAQRHDLRVVEDMCDAVGSRYKGRNVGTFGDVATVSFYPAHHMTTGEGGAVLTNNPRVYREAVSIRDWGRDCTCRMDRQAPVCGDRWRNPDFDHRYYYTRIGLNFKMNEMTAAFGREQLKRLDGFIELRRRNYDILATELGEPLCGEISPFAYPLMSPRRNETMAYLEKAGIETRVLFTGNILKHPAYRDIDCRVVGELPESERLFREAYFVGVGPHLTEENMLYIARTINDCK